MKTINLRLITLACLFLCACSGNEATQTEANLENASTEPTESSPENTQESSSDGEGIRRYGIKSGIIEYKISGLQNGTEVIYFDNWGIKEAKYTKTELNIAGVSSKEDKVVLMDGEWSYDYDAIQKKGTKLKNPLYEMFKNMKEKDLKSLGEKMMKGMGGEKTGEETILGKPCEVWEVKELQMKVWVWENISLKTETNLMERITVEATKIQENVAIPADKFSAPDDIEFQDVSKMMKDIPGLENDN